MSNTPFRLQAQSTFFLRLNPYRVDVMYIIGVAVINLNVRAVRDEVSTASMKRLPIPCGIWDRYVLCYREILSLERRPEMTTDERLERLERELTRTKRHNRWLLAIGGTVVLTLVLARVFSGGLNTAQAQGKGSEKKVIIADQFVLKDERGKVRALLGMIEGWPALILSDEKSQMRAALSVKKDAPMLTLYDEKGKVCATLAVGKDGGTSLGLDENGKLRASMSVFNNRPMLALFDEKGIVMWSAP